MGEIDVLPSDFSFFFYFQFRQVLAKGQDLYIKLKEHFGGVPQSMQLAQS